jgi:hypothetical protein
LSRTEFVDAVADAQKQWIEGSFALATQVLTLQKTYALAVAETFGALAKSGVKEA